MANGFINTLLGKDIDYENRMAMYNYRNPYQVMQNQMLAGGDPSMGGQMGGAMGGMSPYMMEGISPQSPMGYNQLQMQALTNPNPNGIQSAFQEGGLLAGRALFNRGQGPQQGGGQMGPGGPDPVVAGITSVAQKAMQYQQVNQMSEKAAWVKALGEYRNANPNDPVGPRVEAFASQHIAKASNDYGTGAVDPQVAATEGYTQPLAPGMNWVRGQGGRLEQQPAIKMHGGQYVDTPGGQVQGYNQDDAGNWYLNGKQVPAPKGVPSRQIGEVPSQMRDKELIKQSESISSATSLIQGINSVETGMSKIAIAPGGYIAAIADHASDLQGIAKFISPAQGDEPSALDPAKWSGYFAKFANKGVQNQDAQSTILRIAYAMARQIGGTQRVGMTEIKQQLDMLGDGRADPAAVRGALEAVRRGSLQDIESWHNNTFPIIAAGKNASSESVEAYKNVHDTFVKNYGLNAHGKYTPGQVVQGYRFKGGNYTDKNNWEKVETP